MLRFGAVGDVVLTASALATLKAAWPTTRLVFCTKQALAPLVARDPHVDVLLPLAPNEGLWAYRRRLVQEGVEALLDLHGKMRSDVLGWSLFGVPRVVWRKRPWRDNLPVRLALRPYRAHATVGARYHRAVEELVGRALPRGELRHFVGPAEQAKADALLRAAGIDLERPLVGISSGAKWFTKRWPGERFAALAARASAAGYQVLLTGSEAERELGQRIVAAAPAVKDLSGALDLATLGAAINRCGVFVANDSGPMHIARALGVPTLAFFGSTDPGQFEFTGHRVLFAGVPCAPCHFYGRARCPRGHLACMTELGVEQAWSALEELSRAGRQPFVHA